MNIVKASYKVGLEFKKTREGKELLLLYKEAQESVSLNTWKDFEKVGQKRWGKHYFSYPYGLAIFQANRAQEDLPLPLKEDIEKVLRSDKVKLFCNKCEKLGMTLEEVAKGIFAPTIPRTITGIDTPPKLVRALQDLSISCQKTGLFKFLVQNFKSKDFQEKMNEFDTKKKDLNSTPFSHQIRKLARDIVDERISVESIYKMEAFSVVLDILKQVIFESHLDLILDLNNDDIKIFKKRERDKLAIFSIHLNEHMLNIMNWNGSIMKFNLDNRTQFALVKSRQLSWNKQDSPMKIAIRGIIYPYDDSIS